MLQTFFTSTFIVSSDLSSEATLHTAQCLEEAFGFYCKFPLQVLTRFVTPPTDSCYKSVPTHTLHRVGTRVLCSSESPVGNRCLSAQQMVKLMLAQHYLLFPWPAIPDNQTDSSLQDSRHQKWVPVPLLHTLGTHVHFLQISFTKHVSLSRVCTPGVGDREGSQVDLPMYKLFSHNLL